MDKMTNSRTRRKHIRFPHSMIERVELCMAIKKSHNFSAWVVEACRLRLIAEHRRKNN